MPTTRSENPEKKELEHVLKTFLKIKDNEDIRTYVKQQDITTVNDLINCVEFNDLGKDLRITKDDV